MNTSNSSISNTFVRSLARAFARNRRAAVNAGTGAPACIPEAIRPVIEMLEHRQLLAAVTGSAFNYLTAPQNLTFDFNTNVSSDLSLDDLVVDRLSNNSTLARANQSLSYNTGNNRATITFPGEANQGITGMMPDGNFQAIVSEAGISGMTAEHLLNYFFLIADANHDRAVSLDDFSMFQFGTYGNFSQGDFNLSGYVDLDDYTILQANFGRQMPVPLTAANSLQVANLSSSSNRLTWTAPATGTPDGYRVSRSMGGIDFEQIAEVNSSTLTYDDTGLADGTKYWYRVRPYTNADGNGETTNKYSAVTVLPAPYDVYLQATAADAVTLTWTLPSLTADEIQVQMRHAGGSWSTALTLDGNASSAELTGLTNTESYEFRVRRVNTVASAESSYSPTVSLAAQSTPSTPATPTATPEPDGSVALSWSATTGATAYEIERATNSGFTTDLQSLGDTSASQLSYSDSNVVEGTTYHYRIRAINRGTASANSSGTTAVSQMSAPVAPGNVYAVPISSDEIRVTWGDAANETGYLLQRSTAEDFSTGLASIELNAGVVEYVDSVPSDDTYFYRLLPEFSAGVSEAQFSNTSEATLPMGSAVQPAEAFATSIGNDSVLLNWVDSATNETEYRLSRSTSSDMSTDLTILPTQPANTTSYIDTTATGSGPYYYRLVAINPDMSYVSSGTPNVVNNSSNVTIEVVRAAGGTFQTPNNDVYFSNTPVHVRASESTLALFDPLVCRYTWRFMVGSTVLASVRGFNASYSFISSNSALSPKTCTIKLEIDTPRGGSQTVTTPDYDTTSNSVNVKYAKDTREVVTISNTSWNSVQSTIDSKRVSGVLSNIRFFFDSTNAEYFLGGSISLTNASNVEFTSTTGAANPPLLVSNYNINPIVGGPSNSQSVTGGLPYVFQTNANTYGVQLRNLGFGYKPVNGSQPISTVYSLVRGTEVENQRVYRQPKVLQLQGSNLLVDSIRYRKPSGASATINHRMAGIEDSTAFSGLSIQNCRAESGDQDIIRYYLFASGGASGIFVQGNSWALSEAESVVRIQSQAGNNGPSYVNFVRNVFREVGKSALRLSSHQYLFAEGNTLTSDNSNWIGPEPDGGGNDTRVSQYVIVDSNVIDGAYLRINPNLKDAVIRNNVFRSGAHIFLRSEVNQHANDVKCAERVWVVHNTREGGVANPFVLYNYPVEAEITTYDNTLRLRNFHFANNLNTGTATERRGILLNDPGSASWSTQIQAPASASSRWYIQANIWRPDTKFGVDSGTAESSLATWNTYVPNTSGTADDIGLSGDQVLADRLGRGSKPIRADGLLDLSYLKIGMRALPDALLSGGTFSTRQVAWLDANQIVRPRTGAMVGAAEA